jgi:2-polyprenyl-6-methoxyphenol hydroxylase-like FAD-dependent oxidoreductase
VEERASFVVGADGVRSFVAKAAAAAEYDARPVRGTFFYSYFSGFAAGDVEQYVREYQGTACFPTHDGLTLIVAVWPSRRFAEVRSDVEGHVRKVHELAPSVAERMRAAHREEPWVGTKGVPNFFRKPYGPGWALAGDAGHAVDPITAQGISDAFADAEGLAEALDAVLSDRRGAGAAFAEYQRRRDERVRDMYEFTCELATLGPPPHPLPELFAALQHDREGTGRFYAALTGAVPLRLFLDPDNVGRVISAHAGRSRAEA